MLQSLKERYGEKLQAKDGEIGNVRDFYFDDKTWNVRYLVAETAQWLAGRLVLISPQAFGHLYLDGKDLLVNLTRKQIEDSPSIDAHKPVYRQHEEEYHQYYGYQYYAQSMPLWGLAGYPVIVPPTPVTNAKGKGVDAHLRSARHVASYSVEATDGPLGKVIDFQIDGRAWMIRELVAECGHWYASKRIVIPTYKIRCISYGESTIYLDVPTETVINPSDSPRAYVE